MRILRLRVVIPILAIVALSLSGCVVVGPDYKRPVLAVPASYSATTRDGTVPDRWWTLFGDPGIDRLVDEALAANQDLVAAAARVEEARAQLGLTRADRYPEVWVDAEGSRTRLSQETSQLPPGTPVETSKVRLSGNVAFELDFWGRLRRASQAARAELLASVEGRRNVRLGLIADVVTAYLDLLSYDRQLAVARQTRESRQESLRLQRLKFDAGAISELDVAQAEAELASTEAMVPALLREGRQTEDRLGVLLGRVGGAVPRAEPQEAAGELEGLEPPGVPFGLPSGLLERRPDVAAAEQRLIAANARIGIARAAYFPSIQLTGYGGSESKELSGLFGGGTTIWQAALGLVQPIFNAGRAKRDIAATRAREQQALASYTKAVQSAFADVEDALIARSTGIEQRDALERRVEALERARHLAMLRYEEGDSSYLEVLDAERNLFRAQLDLTNARRDALAAAVTLFKALGGGWEVASPRSGEEGKDAGR